MFACRGVVRRADLSLGQPGVGRSHLLQAACLRVEERGELAVYLPLAEVAEYGPALLDNLEQSELVCLDDLDAVAGDATWEEALFHLFNRLRDAGRRLLLAADASPRELAIKLPDLQSRLSLALVFQLQQLRRGQAAGVAVARPRRGLNLPDDVGRFILTRGSRSMNALFELLDQLDQASLQAQRKLTIPFLAKPWAGRGLAAAHRCASAVRSVSPAALRSD